MNWLMVLLLFNVQTGELSTHTEQLFNSQKECDAAGTSHVSGTQYPDGLKATYICLSSDQFTPPAPKDDKKPKRFGIFG